MISYYGPYIISNHYLFPHSFLSHNIINPYLANDLFKASNKCCFHKITTMDNVGICIHIFSFLKVIIHLKFNVLTR